MKTSSIMIFHLSYAVAILVVVSVGVYKLSKVMKEARQTIVIDLNRI